MTQNTIINSSSSVCAHTLVALSKNTKETHANDNQLNPKSTSRPHTYAYQEFSDTEAMSSCDSDGDSELSDVDYNSDEDYQRSTVYLGRKHRPAKHRTNDSIMTPSKSEYMQSYWKKQAARSYALSLDKKKRFKKK